MGDRFTFKDFVFVMCLLLVVAAVLLAMGQYNRQESRLNDLIVSVEGLSKAQQQQSQQIQTLNEQLKNGAGLSNNTATKPAGREVVRRKTPDGGLYVYYPVAPTSPRDPRKKPDYAAGDWLVINLGSEPAYVTPYIAKDAYGSDVQDFVLQTLIIRNPETLEYEPFLAESYEIIPSKLTYRFVLRENIWFSDRTPITADDVIYSFKVCMMPGIDADRAQSYLKKIKEVRKVDERTIDVEFSEPYFMGLEVAGAFVEVIPAKHYQFSDPKEYNNWTDRLIGSGPYLFDKSRWKKGQQLEMVRNENYWGPRPTFDRIVLRFISNQQAALQAFQSGEIDSHNPTPDQFKRLSEDSEFTKNNIIYKFKRPNAGYRYIGWNLRKSIFADKETRQALTMLIDRTGINETLMRGLVYDITGPFSPMVEQNNPNIKPWPYDPAQARKKLTAAGWKQNARGVLERNGEELSFSLLIPSQNVIAESISTYVKEEYRKAGVDMRISPLEFSVLVEKLDNREFDAAMLGWTGGIEGDPYQIWHSASAKDKGSNFVGFINKRADELIETGRRELDKDKRMKIWHEFHAVVHDESPYLFLGASMSLSFVNKRFQNTEPYPVGLNNSDWYVPATQQKYR